jgi:hypothetical protein
MSISHPDIFWGVFTLHPGIFLERIKKQTILALPTDFTTIFQFDSTYAAETALLHEV